MARGKHAAAAAERRLTEAQERIAQLERELLDVKAAARRREVEYKESLSSQGVEVSRRTARRVQEVLTEQTGRIADGLGSAAWHAQKVAMTEHLTWLFLKGYVTWNRFEGDREVLSFLATHGDLRAWFALTTKYAHMSNHADRRAAARRHPVKQMLAVLGHIERAGKEVTAREDREKLDALVDYARTAFVNVELRDVLTKEGWTTVEPSEEDLAIHRDILDHLPQFRDVLALTQ